MKRGKNYRTARARADKNTELPVGDALRILDSFPKAKFDETIDCAVRLNVNPRHADQMVRGTVVMPNGTGKTVRVLVITRGPKEQEAKNAGADMVGADEYLPKIKDGWTDVDVIIATPDMMGELGKLGRILGPRGLMPNPKVGTVTMDIAKAVKEAKAGRIEYRVDKAGIVHAPVGKRSFGPEKLEENVKALYRELIRVKPAAVKGIYVKSIFISGTMTPSLRLDANSLA
ncbi:MAG TPA: 50S ribosomal protein L1 [Candidatus Krumholzibacteria bacterium]|nr:50S ribosomal protein L1 [Candidatus Krumholzibacteria bacterium]HPD72043.1 50S ribosomal protein L1 [Candidatus Krumholzibacteria bacterium]HRY41024.1 50S ribosomal protein L1 [Candidatus Krumholzibacteria bacterium]